MKYNTATIEAVHINGGPVYTIDLDGLTLSGLCAELRELIPPADDDEREADTDADPEAIPDHVCTINPSGFAVHLFQGPHQSRTANHVEPVASFDELLFAWQAESDSDRREAMGEYLVDMGANDLSDFDEAYQGQFDSGAAFAEQLCEDLGTVPKDLPSWIAIDWEQTWNGGLRFDYHITDSGHVFRNL